MSEHAQCLNCRHARKPTAPARGQVLCLRVGTLADATGYCAGHPPADMARRIADAFRPAGGSEAVRA